MSIRKEQQRILRPLYLLILIPFILGACATEDATGPDAAQEAQPTITSIPPPPVAERPTVAVARGIVQERLEFTGQWLPRDQQALSFPVNGTVRSVNVQRGDSVQTDALLADFQIQDLENQLDSALLNLETAERRVASGSESGDAVLGAQSALASANLSLEQQQESAPWIALNNAIIGLENAQQTLESAERSYNAAISDPASPASAVNSALDQLENARRGVRSAQNSYYSAAEQYRNWEYQVLNAENQQLQAEIQLQSAVEGAGVSDDLIDSLRSAQLQVDQVREQIAQSSLFAPFGGVVLEVTIRPGDTVQAFNKVITLALPDPSEIIANLSFNDIQRLDIGQLGICQIANREETRVQCVVRTKPFTSQEADQTVRIAADFVDQLQLGQLIEVEMPLQTREDVLYLPPRAIRTFQNRTFVVIRTEDGERVVDIEIGLQTDDRIEVISGLSEGDQVVLP